ncbi:MULTISPECIES: hypothetical protein [Psychrobacter]|uniref:hypothetical protein n=1 Tax=Psychrobacter TaxID=497 RepID=UPI00146D4AD9|nr:MULTISPECIES: hypothetical protein [Psychrobacter]
MVVSLTRMLTSFGQPSTEAAQKNASETPAPKSADYSSPNQSATQNNSENNKISNKDLSNNSTLTERYLANKARYQRRGRPPFDMTTRWQLRHGHCPMMTELIDVVDPDILNAMPIEAVAVLDRINGKLSRYREWSAQIDDNHSHDERKFVIDKLIQESIPEAIHHYQQLQRFSPHRTKNSVVQSNMTAGDLLTDLFLQIDYELDELLDELHQTVVNRLASTHRYVKNRTKHS